MGMSKESANHRSAKSRIVTLAESAGVCYQRTSDDDLAEVISRLSDAEVETDDIEGLVVALKRAGVISGAEMVELLGDYLEEKHQACSEDSECNR